MMKINHTAISTAGALASVAIAFPSIVSHPAENTALIGAVAVGGFFGAILPDYDIKIPVSVSTFVFRTLFTWIPRWKKNAKSAGHRTYSHCLLAVLFLITSMMVTGYFAGYGGVVFFLTFGILFGAIFHIIADMTTVSGIPLFWPHSKEKHHILPAWMRIVTGKTKFEHLYALILVFISLFIFFSRGTAGALL